MLHKALRLASLCSVLIATACVTGCAATGDPGDSGEDGGEHRASALSGSVRALWVHGRAPNGGGTPGDYEDFSYWGDAGEAAGADKKAVNWGGADRVSESNGWVRNALDCFCTGENWCVIAGHSAGDPQIGYALAYYGASERAITDGVPDGSGRCGAAGGSQSGWNIKWVEVAGGASGGTELADLGDWAVSDPLTGDLRTDTARALYDHSATQGVWFYRFAGAKGTLYSGALPGQDDEVIAYHSSGGMAETGSFCNPGDWACGDTLPYDEAASPKRNVAKWDHHTVWLRDDGEAYDHYARGKWGGIVSPLRADMDKYAQ
jgi:hypothetical protein